MDSHEDTISPPALHDDTSSSAAPTLHSSLPSTPDSHHDEGAAHDSPPQNWINAVHPSVYEWKHASHKPDSDNDPQPDTHAGLSQQSSGSEIGSPTESSEDDEIVQTATRFNIPEIPDILPDDVRDSLPEKTMPSAIQSPGWLPTTQKDKKSKEQRKEERKEERKSKAKKTKKEEKKKKRCDVM
jgi:hypothetical protein